MAGRGLSPSSAARHGYYQISAAWYPCQTIMVWRDPHSSTARRSPGQPSAVWPGPYGTVMARVPSKLPRLGAAHTSLRLGVAPANHLWLGVVQPGVPAGPSWPGAAYTSLWLDVAPAKHLRSGVASAKLLRPGVPAGPSLPGAAHISLRLGAADTRLLRLGVYAKTSWPGAGHSSMHRSNYHGWARPNHFMWLGGASSPTKHLRPRAVLAVLLRP